MFNNLKKLISLVFATVLLTSISSTSFAIDKLHFVIGGGAGGGWDGTARGTGEALTKAGFLKSASYENMSGGGGGKALSYIINSKPEGTVLVQSTPLVLIMNDKALPPPPPDIFSNDALFKKPAFVSASPVPLAVPSQPPPAPPPITKCNLSIAKLVDEIEVKRTVAKTKLINFFKLLNMLFSSVN